MTRWAAGTKSPYLKAIEDFMASGLLEQEVQIEGKEDLSVFTWVSGLRYHGSGLPIKIRRAGDKVFLVRTDDFEEIVDDLTPRQMLRFIEENPVVLEMAYMGRSLEEIMQNLIYKYRKDRAA